MSISLAMAAAALGALALPASAAARAPAASVSTTCPAVAHHENAKHNGNNCSTVGPNAVQLWSDTLNGPASYPVIANGSVFVTTSSPGGAYGGSLYALSAQTGKVLWGPVPLSGTYYYFPLAFDAGRVFVNNFDGTVTAFDAATGAQDWATATSYFSSEPVATNGMVWVHGSSSLYGLSETTGAISVQSGYLDGDGAVPAVNNSGVFLSTGCQSQYKLSFTGTTVWSDNNGCSGGGGGSTALFSGLMYGGDGDQILNETTGQLVGTFSGVPAFNGTTGFFANGTAVTALDVAQKNTPLWTANLPAAVVAGPVATGSAVWVGTSASTLVALSPASGAVLATIVLPGAPGGGGQYSGDPSDIGVGNNILVAPTGSMVTAFG
jgi:outer membrane protein assembly factor BamB